MQGLGAKRGIADIIGLLPNGRLLAIEVKTSKGKITGNQEMFLDAINQNKGIAIIARSTDDLKPIEEELWKIRHAGDVEAKTQGPGKATASCAEDR